MTSDARQEDRLASREWELALALEVAELGLWDWHLDSDRVRADARARTLFGVGREEALTGLGVLFRNVHPGDVEQVWACDAAARAARRFRAELGITAAGGAERWVRVDATGAHDAGRMIGVIGDITGQRQAEQARRRDQEALEALVLERTERLMLANTALANEVEERRAAESQVRELLGQIVSAEEAERQRVARELHDTVGQHLTGLTLRLALITNAAQPPEDWREQLMKLRESITRLDDDVERLSQSLSPRTLQDLGLEDALNQHTAEWARETGIELQLATRGLTDRRWEPTVETTVFRFVQEALTNVARHAQARNVTVIVERRYAELRVIVEDDGVGFDPSAKGTGGRRGLGLRGMAERAALAGGRMEIETRPGAGATLFLALPLASGSG
jgi:signal transduction histidine kinase